MPRRVYGGAVSMTDAHVGAALHHTQWGISFFILLLSLKVLQPRDFGQASGTPRDSHHSSQQLPPTAPRPLSHQPRFDPRKPLCLQMESCAISSYRQSNPGWVYNYSSCFFLYYPSFKNLTSVLDVHPPPHYLSIMYFLSLHLLFEKTL